MTESLTNLEILLNNSQTEEMVARVSKGQNETQDVPYRAQLNYLKGLVYVERDEKELAKKALNLALTLSPDFQNASDKLGSLRFFIKSTSFTYIYIFFILFHEIIIMRSHDYLVPLLLISINILSIFSATSGSRLPVGSSAMINLGSFTIALAITNLCCSPPDNS